MEKQKIFRKLFLGLSFIGMLGMGWACVDEDAPENWAPGFQTISSENVMRTTATLVGQLTGSVNLVKEYGFQYSESNNFPADKTEDVPVGKGAPTGSFRADIFDLEPNQRYYYRVFASTGSTTVYSEANNFDTPSSSAPTLSHISTDSIGENYVRMTCRVDDIGDEYLLEYGVGYKTKDESSYTPIAAKGFVDEAQRTYVVEAKNLEPSTTYTFRPYAKNSLDAAGNNGVREGYGETFDARTEELLSPEVETSIATAGISSVKVSGVVNSADGSNGKLLDCGFVWSATNEEPRLELNDESIMLKAPERLKEYFDYTITGLIPSTTYYVCAFARNEVAGETRIGYGKVMSFTTEALVRPNLNIESYEMDATSITLQAIIANYREDVLAEKGFIYSRTNAEVDLNEAKKANTVLKVTSGAKQFSGSIKDLTMNTPYYVRAYAIYKADNVEQEEGYSEAFEIWTSDFQTPSIDMNLNQESITRKSVELTGKISSQGNGEITERGFVLIPSNITSEPTLEHKDAIKVVSDENFVSTVDGLSYSTSYAVRSYVTSKLVDKVKTVYSGTQYFDTKAVAMPGFNNVNVSDVTYEGFKVSCGIVNVGDGTLVEKGFCWKKNQSEFTLADCTDAEKAKVDGEDISSFEHVVTGIQSNSNYYVRAYAKVNVDGTEMVAYTSSTHVGSQSYDLPGLESPTVSDDYLTRNSALLEGLFYNEGNGTITQKGFVLSLTTKTYDPTLNNCLVKVEADSDFKATVNDLTPNTEYAAHAFAIVNWGEQKTDTVYSGWRTTFYTKPIVTSTFNNMQLEDANYHSVKATCGVSEMGDGTFVEKGFFWKRNSTDFSEGKDSMVIVSDTHTEFSQVIDGLESESWYYVGAYTKNNVDGKDVISTSGWSEVWIPAPSMPAIDNFGVVEAGYRAVRPTATIVMHEDGELTESGFCWNLLPEDGDWTEPTLEACTESVKMEGDLKTLDAVLEDLEPSRSYYIRAYAKVSLVNGERVVYSHTLQFEVQGRSLPVLNYYPDIAWDKITRNSAEVKTGIDNAGNGEITHRGFVLAPTSKTTEPTIENCELKWDDVDETFTKTVTGLKYNTEYVVRGFVVAKWEEETDTVYNRGTNSFRTLEAVLPSFAGLAFSGQGLNTFTVSSEITDMGDGTLKEKGFCWNRSTSDFNLNTETTESKAVEGDALSLTVDSLDPNTRYYVKAYAKVDIDGNEMIGYSGWNEVQTTAYNHPSVNSPSIDRDKITRNSAYLTATLSNQGNGAITERGFVLSLTSVTNEPTLENNEVKVVADESFTATVTELAWNTEYAVRAYVISKWEDSGLEETVYSGWRSTFRTDAVAVPTFNNISTSDATYSSFNVKCGIASLGDAAAEDFIEKGFLWSFNHDATLDNCIGSMKVEDGTNEEFTDSIGGLVPGTYYYFRAYAKVKVDDKEVVGYSSYVHSRTNSLGNNWNVDTKAQECNFKLTFNDEADNVASAYVLWSVSSDELNAGNGTKLELTKDETTHEFTGKLENLTHDTTYYYKVYYVYVGNEIELRSSSFHTQRIPQAGDNVSPDKKE